MTKRQHPSYRTWAGMLTRCRNPNEPCFKYYGGKGIKVCERWLVFENFAADMGEKKPGQTIGRIDNNKDYCPENCRWEDMTSQARNKSNNKIITFNGEIKTLAEWSEQTGIGYSTILHRIKAKWEMSEFLGYKERTHKRPGRRVLFTYKGEKKSLPEWADQFGIKRSTLAQRIYGYGWDINKALEKG